jgi:3-oxo-5-alpha-steroid 4-dehydrogenase 3 / polyprenol reductase
VFLIASGVQYDCHEHLASLKGYTVPPHPIFHRVLCPHYTAECAIYLALSFLAAPRGEMINKTVLSGFLFVIINLGITAHNTKQWYKTKFGEESVRGKWKMIPGVF